MKYKEAILIYKHQKYLGVTPLPKEARINQVLNSKCDIKVTLKCWASE